MDFPDMYMKDDIPIHLCQGDIFRRLRGKVLPRTKPKAIGFIVATYTCDFINPKDLRFVSVCPVYKLEVMLTELVEKHKTKKFKNLKIALIEKLHQLSNYKPTFYFFLSPLPEFDDEAAYANLGQIFSIKESHIESILTNRFAVLKSPWREKLGHKIGFLYNRVATKEMKQEPIEGFVTKALLNLMPEESAIYNSSSDKHQ